MAVQETVRDLSAIPLSGRATPASNRTLIIHTLPALVAVCSVILVIASMVLIVSTIGGYRLGIALVHPNPFIPYEALWPGQATASVQNYALNMGENITTQCFSTVSESQNYSGSVQNVTYDLLNLPDNKVVCINTPADGFFRSMNLTLDNNRVQELDLFSDKLEQDTLMLYWGAPDAMTRGQNGHSLYLIWNRGTYSATAMMNQPGTLVNLVTLIAKA